MTFHGLNHFSRRASAEFLTVWFRGEGFIWHPRSRDFDFELELHHLSCTYFAVAGEFEPDDYYNMNTGAMLMNLSGLREVDADFRAYVKALLDELVHEAWDQGAYRRYFGWDRGALLWDRLPPTMNWKPYWSDAAGAGIVHFHGIKPHES
jgi:hypothetical protein